MNRKNTFNLVVLICYWYICVFEFILFLFINDYEIELTFDHVFDYYSTVIIAIIKVIIILSGYIYIWQFVIG